MAFGAVDLVIGYDPQSSPRNDCERQGAASWAVFLLYMLAVQAAKA